MKENILKVIKPDNNYNQNYRNLVAKRPSLMVGYNKFNDDWYLSDRGDMNHVSDYPIDADQLEDDDWILHLMEKSWFDANTFLPAYYHACRLAGVQSVEMTIYYGNGK